MTLDRHEARHRQRRVIFNNDGCDVYYFPTNHAPTAQNLLNMRTARLADTHVDTLVYTTISAGFSHFTHQTRVGEFLETDFGKEGARNIARPLIDQGRDCLRIMVDFAHRHGMECFWSMRMCARRMGHCRRGNHVHRWSGEWAWLGQASLRCVLPRFSGIGAPLQGRPRQLCLES